MTSWTYSWGYHSSDEQYVHVSRVEAGGRTKDLFDVTLYDPEYTDPDTNRNAMDQSLLDLRKMIGLANAALAAGLAPEPVPDKTT